MENFRARTRCLLVITADFLAHPKEETQWERMRDYNQVAFNTELVKLGAPSKYLQCNKP